MAGLFGLKNRRKAAPFCSAVVVAAGSSSRMGGEDKIMMPLLDTPVIIHTLKALEFSQVIHEIIVVTREDLIVPIANLCSAYGLSKVTKVILGGETRLHSVRQGLLEVNEKAKLIAVQDGARPLLTGDVLEEVVAAASSSGAAAPAIPVKDTIKCAENGVVETTPDRSKLFAVQTPQVFEADLIRVSIYKAIEDEAAVTDDCSAVELLGKKVLLTKGSEENIKITTPTDMILAEGILKGRNSL